MSLRIVKIAASMAAMAAPAAALDVTEMTAAERAAFRAEVRDYILENPEIIAEAIEALEARQQMEQVARDRLLVSQNLDAIFEDGYSWVGGNPDGDITLVEFVDYRCGYCRRAHEDVAELVRSDGNIRFVVKEFPILGEDSVQSTRFAVAVKQIAGDDAYFEAHNALIAMRSSASEPALRRLAESLGLDAAPILAHMDSDEVTDELRRTRALASLLEVNGTPTFVVQSELLRGYMPLDGMRQMVADQRG